MQCNHIGMSTDEIKLDGDWHKKISTLNVMKPLMTNTDFRMRPLFHNWKDIYSTCNFMLFTGFLCTLWI